MNILTKLQCQNCSAVLDRGNNYQQTLKCKYCGSTYQIEKPADSSSAEVLIPKAQLKPIKPDDLEISQRSGSLEVVKRWRKKGSFILLGMASIWLALMLNELAKTWLEGADASILILLVMVAVGGLLMYRALSEIFNRSTLRVNKQSVTLETKPFMWKGDFKHDVNKIKYFEIVPPPGPTLSVSTRLFRLCAVTDGDMRLTLINKIRKPGHAIYLLREINDITNRQ